MGIDGRGVSLSRASQDRIAALVSQNERLAAALKHTEGFVAEQGERYGRELSEVLGERDRARAIAVELEGQLSKVMEELEDLQRYYEEKYFATGTTEAEHAKTAADDCWSSAWVATDVIIGDQFEANHLEGGRS
jgi:hypothetical protein